MFVLNPDPYLLPTYRISPFQTNMIGNETVCPDKGVARVYLNERFGIGNWLVTRNGREGIKLALDALVVKSGDLLTIQTTSNNRYISSCVTNTIGTKCRWNRCLGEETDVIFVNHEFGYPLSEMNDLLHTGRPIIEDCCTAFYSQDGYGKVGEYGDYAIYSFPKFFGMQLGGLLVGENVGAMERLFKGVSLTADEREYVLAVLGGELRGEREMLVKRKKIFDYATGRFHELGFSLRFPKQDGVVPSVLLLSNNDVIADLSAHKEFLSKHGIQNSIFYGEDAFFLPCHQNLTEKAIDYFIFLVDHFIKQQ